MKVLRLPMDGDFYKQIVDLKGARTEKRIHMQLQQINSLLFGVRRYRLW
jgi:hypothetical protein